MNIKFNDSSFINTATYKNFMSENSGTGKLNVKVSFAEQALPVPNLKIVVSKEIGNYNVIFFEGLTDISGSIGPIILPTPPTNKDNMVVPQFTIYKITATYNGRNYDYEVSMYDGIQVLQNINVVLNGDKS